MPGSSSFIFPIKTIAGRRTGLLLLTLAVSLGLASCAARQTVATKAEEEEAIARTEFTERVENFFEYEPLKAGKPSQFRIHLTDLSDGSPVEQAEVTLSIRAQSGGTESSEMKAKVGKVTGIYVAEVAIAKPGAYNIEFRVKNTKLDERLPLADFKVE